MAAKKKTARPEYATCDECGYRVEVPAEPAALEPAVRARVALSTAAEMGVHRCAEMRAERRAEAVRSFARTLDARVAAGPAALTKMAANVEANQPSLRPREARYALAQSSGVFEAVAKSCVASWALGMLAGSLGGDAFEPWTPEQLMAEAQKEVHRRCRYAYNKSTSSTSNLMDDFEASAYAELVEDLQWVVGK